MKKLLDSDCLRTEESKCNTVQKSVTLVGKVKYQWKLDVEILNYDWLKDNRIFPKAMISCQMMTKIFKRTFKKVFLSEKK